MVWSPELWRQELEGMVEKCAQKVLAELEEEVMGRLKVLSEDIIGRICLPDLAKKVESDLQNGIYDGIGLSVPQNLPLNQEVSLELINEPVVKEPIKESVDEPVKESFESLWYAFCIVKEEQTVWPLINGIEDLPCQIIWQDSPFESEESQVPGSERPLGLLACAVPESEYDEIPLHEHLQDLAWVEIRARRHEEVLLEIMKVTTIIPLPFGTIFREKDHIQSQLRNHRRFWQLELARLAGHYEMQLKFLVDPQKLEVFLEKNLPYSGEQGGGGYFLKRQWEKKLEAEQEALIDTYSESLFQDLKSMSVEVKLTGKEETLPNGLKQIFTAQFLLIQENRPAWEEILQTFDQKADSLGFILEITGPWPTYHFAGLDKLGKLNEEERHSGGNKQ
jgi:Gas vesicle synthesis protein GvpL/GvpF.